MKLKKLLAILLALSMFLSLAACGAGEGQNDLPETTQTQLRETDPAQTDPTETEAPETEPTETEPEATEEAGSVITPLLYKVTDTQGNVIWLFGSIHVGKDYFYPLPGYVTDAYESAEALAVECDIVAFETDVSAQMSALQPLIYTDGTTISDHIPEELYTASVEIMEGYGIYSSVLDYYRPSLWFSFIDNILYEQLGVNSELGIDMHFLNRAHTEGKEILEVESVQFQYSMLANFSEELQILLLESSVEGYHAAEETEKELMELVEAWASGDEAVIGALLNEEAEFESDEEALLYQEYNDAMITTRNLSMADFAEEMLESGKEVFICVGAAHVVGEGAVAQLLSERGYTVEIVR